MFDLQKLLSSFMFYFLLILQFFFSSCQADSDLFDEEITAGVDITDPDFNAQIENTLQNAGNIDISNSSALRIFYVAVDGSSSNSGLTESEPLDILTAFNIDKIEPGDLYWVKAGDYGKINIALNQVRKTAGTAENPIGWFGYKDTPGDIEAMEGPTVSWEDYLANDHDLDPTVMPTLTGSDANAPNFLDNGHAIELNHWKEYIVLRNFQIRQYETGIVMEKGTHNVFDNIIIANNGYFADIPGQGGSNPNLLGSGILIRRETAYNKISNSYTMNMSINGYSLGQNSSSNLVEWSRADSDNDSDHNPQDYFFHAVGRYNVFTNIIARKLTESNHSGHGLCFNWDHNKEWGGQYNYAENVEILNTALHFDGEFTHDNLVKNIKIYEDRDHYIFGCSVVVMDGAHDNVVEDLHLQDGSISFLDSGAHVANGNAGHDNIFRNSLIENNDVGISFGQWSTEFAVSNNQFVDCTFKNLDNLFQVERENYGNTLVDCSIESVSQVWFEESKGRDYILAATTEFENCNFWKSELPDPNLFEVSGTTEKQAND